MTAIQYIQNKGVEHQIKSGQIVLKICPFCGDRKNHFYMDQDDGVYICHKCQNRGNLYTLQKHYGDNNQFQMNKPRQNPANGVVKAFPEKNGSYATPDELQATKYHQMLLNDPEALQYITDVRGISIETVRAFKIGLQIDGDGKRWLAIPHYENGKLVNIKSRSLPQAEKAFRRVPNCRSILFNVDALKVHEDEIIITEGEIDALTLLDQKTENVIGVTTGAGSFDPAWIDQLQAVKKVILCYDPDEAGQKGAREVARRLGYDRCFNLVLPDSKDVNEFFNAGNDVFDFQKLVNEARQFDVTGIMSLADGLNKYREELEKPDQTHGLITGWPSVDQIIRTGFMPGELIVLSAPPKIGKSSFALQIASYNALHDIPSLFFCLEMRPMKIIEKIVKCKTGRDSIGDIEIINVRQAFKNKPLYLGYCYQKPTVDGIMDTLRAAIQRYGLKLVVFDHLHFLCRSVNNQVQEIGLAVQAFKFLAEELEIPVILIAQPRKIQADSIMTAMDLKDSASIYSDCDHLIILHRNRKVSEGAMEGAILQTEAFDPITLVRIEASRYNAGGECLLNFHGEYSRFDDDVRI